MSGEVLRNMGRDVPPEARNNDSQAHIDWLAEQSAQVEAERNTQTYSDADYSALAHDTIESVTGAHIVDAFAQDGFMYVKMDANVDVGAVAHAIHQATGLNVYETEDPSYIVLK